MTPEEKTKALKNIDRRLKRLMRQIENRSNELISATGIPTIDSLLIAAEALKCVIKIKKLISERNSIAFNQTFQSGGIITGHQSGEVIIQPKTKTK